MSYQKNMLAKMFEAKRKEAAEIKKIMVDDGVADNIMKTVNDKAKPSITVEELPF